MRGIAYGNTDASEAEIAKAKELHAVWLAASTVLEHAEVDLKCAQDDAVEARDAEAKASESYLDFHTAYWAKRGEPS